MDLDLFNSWNFLEEFLLPEDQVFELTYPLKCSKASATDGMPVKMLKATATSTLYLFNNSVESILVNL